MKLDTKTFAFNVCPWVSPFPGFEPADHDEVAYYDFLTFELRPEWKEFMRPAHGVEVAMIDDGEVILVRRLGPGIRLRLPVRGGPAFGEREI